MADELKAAWMDADGPQVRIDAPAAARATPDPPSSDAGLSLEGVVDAIAGAVTLRPCRGLRLVLVDGIPACGKSTLARRLAGRLEARGLDATVVENDWFIARSIRSPGHLLAGLAIALSRRPIAERERLLLERFLDDARLGDFLEELKQAEMALEAGLTATLAPQGAFWNLAYPRAWQGHPLVLRPGAVLIIEGTLCRAVYQPRFPEHLSLLVEAPLEDARTRFHQRNQRIETRRNFAFSLLARVGPAYRIAAEMIGRNREAFDLRLEMDDPDSPVLIRR